MKATFSDIIERIKKFKHLKNDIDVAKLLHIARSNFSDYKARNSIPLKRLSEFAAREHLSMDWLLEGEGDLVPAAAETASGEQAHEPARTEIDGLLKAARTVLLSGNMSLSEALKSNIVAFHYALESEATLQRRIEVLEKALNPTVPTTALKMGLSTRRSGKKGDISQ